MTASEGNTTQQYLLKQRKLTVVEFVASLHVSLTQNAIKYTMYTLYVSRFQKLSTIILCTIANFASNFSEHIYRAHTHTVCSLGTHSECKNAQCLSFCLVGFATTSVKAKMFTVISWSRYLQKFGISILDMIQKQE